MYTPLVLGSSAEAALLVCPAYRKLSRTTHSANPYVLRTIRKCSAAHTAKCVQKLNILCIRSSPLTPLSRPRAIHHWLTLLLKQILSATECCDRPVSTGKTCQHSLRRR